MYTPTYLFFELVDKTLNKYVMKVAKTVCLSHEENIDIMLELVFGRIPKVDIILKTYKYFLTKFGQYMAKSHM